MTKAGPKVTDVFDKRFRVTFLFFILLNVSLYVFILKFNSLIKFDEFNYTQNSHHFLEDKRVTQNKFDLFNALGQYDAQWYLKIASEGYPASPTIVDIKQRRSMNGLAYAYFPLFPKIISFTNLFFRNVELAAFVTVNALLLLSFVSLYWVVAKLYLNKTATKASMLVFVFPFSIFYRSYFTEGLFLFLLLWFAYFLIKKKYLVSAIFLGLLNITKANGFLLNIVFSYYFFKDIGVLSKTGRETQKSIFTLWKNPKLLVPILIVIFPFTLWIFYNLIQTGNAFYFYSVRAQWLSLPFPTISPLYYNTALITSFFKLPLHYFHFSQIDVLAVITILLLLIKSKEKLNKKLWLISLFLWLFPLITTDLMSFTRYQIVLFPLFVYLSQKLSNKAYYLLFSLSLVGLFWVSLVFVNWHWLG